jgi:two-component sensor histidine kinase
MSAPNPSTHATPHDELHFLAIASHELRNPLGALVGYADLLLEEVGDRLNGEQLEALRKLGACARELLDVLNTALEVARAEAHSTIRIREVTVREILREVAGEFEHQNGGGVRRIVCHVAPSASTLLTDDVKLKMVLRNLIGNALKFSHHEPVSVTADGDGAGVDFYIRDHGSGIRTSALMAVFEPYRQLEEAAQGNGLGLGLYVVKRLVEALGGTIAILSQPGDGSCVCLRIPSCKPIWEPVAVAPKGPGSGEQSERRISKLDSPLAVFRREAEFWTAAYAGTVSRLKDTKGLRYIAHLIKHPGQEFHALDLAIFHSQARAESSGLTRALKRQGVGECVLDPKARREYKLRLEELRQDLHEAEQSNDLERAAKVREEIKLLAGEFASAVSADGRNRRISAEAQRARLAVTKRIKESLWKIRTVNPALARHLSKALKTGYFCSYEPDPERPVRWAVGP